jgi:hypothetical protein
MIDIRTQKGGEGQDQPDGSFLTGEIVNLTARVTYSGDPVQHKLVAFEVLDPLNESVLIVTAVSDEDGYASTSFRIPVLSESEGTWTAISVVSIVEKAVWDTVRFRVYLEMPVGGYTVSIKGYRTESPIAFYVTILAVLATLSVVARQKIGRIAKKHPLEV